MIRKRSFIAALAATPFASATDSSATVVTTDREVVQPLILVTRDAPTAEVARVIDAARAAGF